MELGVDVGNLDRVIQIDSPTTVSSFLQRMGRTGRRQGGIRNCLFLTTSDGALMQAAGLIDLWREGYVEPIQPPPAPYHVLAQQLMALILQERGIGKNTWLEWIARVPAFAEMPVEHINEVVARMLSQGILWEEQDILAIGRKGEETFGRRHFLELLSVFLSPPMFRVLHGRQELGGVDELTFLGKQGTDRVLLLGGRAWHVVHIDWQRKIAYVEPSEASGRTRWKGSGPGLSFRLCQAIKTVLAKKELRSCWSQRTRDQIAQMRDRFSLVRDGETVVAPADNGIVWWTFAGSQANASLAPSLAQLTNAGTSSGAFAIELDRCLPTKDVVHAIEHLKSVASEKLCPKIDPEAIAGLKFSECLPPSLAIQMLEWRCQDLAGIEHVRRSRVVVRNSVDCPSK